MSLAVYVHIPFCPQVCHYCDFAVLKAGAQHHQRWWDHCQSELKLRIPKQSSIDTLYFGGGTPSLLHQDLWEEILQFFSEYYQMDGVRELTIECNPESVEADKVKLWESMGVTRLSMGVQSFDSKILKDLGRSHSVDQSHRALEILQASNLDFSADLMFGLPGQDLGSFESDLKTLLTYQPQHMSFYGLTIEPNTLFSQKLARGEINTNESLENTMYSLGVKTLEEAGIRQYELSNFAIPGHEAIHNSKYWAMTPYVGVGPGAHSFDGSRRSWNHRHLSKWSQAIDESLKKSLYQADDWENLGPNEVHNEFIWLSLRQVRGLWLKEYESRFKHPLMLEELDEFQGGFIIEEGYLKLLGRGWELIDDISMKLFKTV